jgi:peptidyl-prolyl cis-trans isomerase C
MQICRAGCTFLPCFKAMSATKRQLAKISMDHMKNLSRRLTATALGIAFLSATIAFAPTAHSQEAAPENPEAEQKLDGENQVIAKVNGYEIRTSEVRMAFDDVMGRLPNLPKKLRYPFVVEFLVERHLLAQLANKEGLADSEDYKRRLAAYQAKALHDSYLAQVIRPKVTEEEIRAVYDAESKKLEETERIRVRMILVASEKEAQSILDRLNNGEKFEDLAKQYSLDGSKDYGGDLGYFTAPEMVPAFSQAAFALQKGEVSKPVKTDFGWHIIKLEDRKKGVAQPYDQVKSAIRSVLVRQKVNETLATLKTVAKVEILDEDLKKIADEAAKQRKLLLEQQNKQTISGDSGTEGDSGGKGDLLLPEEGSNPQ